MTLPFLKKIVLFLLILNSVNCSSIIEKDHTKTNQSKKVITPKSGYYEEKYPNGNIWSSCNYKNGLKHGKTTSFYPNGQLRYVGFYKEDRKSDVWLFYKEDGTFIKEVNFKNNNN